MWRTWHTAETRLWTTKEANPAHRFNSTICREWFCFAPWSWVLLTVFLIMYINSGGNHCIKWRNINDGVQQIFWWLKHTTKSETERNIANETAGSLPLWNMTSQFAAIPLVSSTWKNTKAYLHSFWNTSHWSDKARKPTGPSPLWNGLLKLLLSLQLVPLEWTLELTCTSFEMRTLAQSSLLNRILFCFCFDVLWETPEIYL